MGRCWEKTWAGRGQQASVCCWLLHVRDIHDRHSYASIRNALKKNRIRHHHHGLCARSKNYPQCHHVFTLSFNLVSPHEPIGGNSGSQTGPGSLKRSISPQLVIRTYLSTWFHHMNLLAGTRVPKRDPGLSKDLYLRN